LTETTVPIVFSAPIPKGFNDFDNEGHWSGRAGRRTVRGPATLALATYEVRERDGEIQVRV
jgi:hypothetical protein